MKNIFLLLLVNLILLSCVSTKNFNEKVTKIHSVEELKEDVDYLFYQLESNFPNLYGYISKEDLDQKIYDFKSDLKPMTTMEFFHKLYPLVAEVRQGHLSLRPVFPIRDRKERRKYRKATSNFNDIDFIWIEDQVIIEDTYGKKIDSLIIGSRLTAIDSIKTEDLMKRWVNKIASDGFNTTFQPHLVADNILTFYKYEVGRTDSITLHLQKADSVFIQPLYYKFKSSKKEKKNNKDSINENAKKDTLAKKSIKLTRAEKKVKRKKNREEKRFNKKRGYSRLTDKSTREFKMIGIDSSIAYLKIRGFSGGHRWSRQFYEETFHIIDSLDSKNLILDLRDNTGGSLKEIGNLYGYLTNSEYTFIKPMKTKTRMVETKTIWSRRPTFFGNFFKIFATPGFVIYDIFRTKKEGGKFIKMNKYTKPQMPKQKAFKGDLYVLINGLSFSASSILSNNLHGSKRAVFIGEETGGAYNSTVAGMYLSRYLPNSKLFVPVWMMNFESDYNTDPDGFGVKPDIEVQPRLKDFVGGKDTVLEKALEVIKSN
jgi:C-terminal processing protease CtpA/Prc